jgi:hypothetical protein
MTYLQQVAGFCRIMELLACVWAEILPTEQSKRKGVAGCVHQYWYCRPCMQVGAGVSERGVGHRGAGGGRGADLPADGAEGPGEHPERGVAVGAGA